MDKTRIKECFFLLYLAGSSFLRDFLMKSCRPSAVIAVVLEVRGRNLKRSRNKRNFAGKKNSKLLRYRQRCCLSRFESFHTRTIKFASKKKSCINKFYFVCFLLFYSIYILCILSAYFFMQHQRISCYNTYTRIQGVVRNCRTWNIQETLRNIHEISRASRKAHFPYFSRLAELNWFSFITALRVVRN